MVDVLIGGIQRRKISHQRCIFEVFPEYGISDICDYTLGGLRVDDTRKVSVQNAVGIVVFAMHMIKMRAKILEDGFEVVRSVAVGCDVFLNRNARLDLGFQNIGFVEEKHEMYFL